MKSNINQPEVFKSDSGSGAIQGCRLTLTNELGCRIYDLEEHHSCNSNWTQRHKGAKVRKEQQDKINCAKKTQEVVMNGRE